MVMTIIDIVWEVTAVARKKLETLTEQMFYVLLSLRR